MKDKLLGNLETGLLFILSAPAGTGKTTLVRLLLNEFPSVAESVSFTTRPIRHGEEEGLDYHFVGEAEFLERIESGDFLEYAKVFGSYYGTSKEYVFKRQEEGKDVILVIDTQGALQVKDKTSAISIFIHPPNLEELRERLFKRKTESVEKIEERLSWAKKEMEMATHYDYQLVNDNLHNAYDILRSILIAEEHRRR